MKILYVIDQKPDGYPGGIEYHQLDLIKYSQKHTIPVSLLFPEEDSLCLRDYTDDRIKENRYPGGRLDDHRLKDPVMEESFQKILQDTEPDIVHFQSIRTMPLSLVEVARNAGRKVIASLHEYYFWCINCIMLAPDFCWFEQDGKRCFKCLTASNYKISEGYMKTRREYIDYLFRIMDRIIVPSLYVRDVFLSLYRVLTREKCSVIEFGVDRKILEDSAGIKKRMKTGTLKLAFLGNFLHYKGNKTFLELLNHYKHHDAPRLSIIGNIFDPSLVPYNQNLTVAGGYTRDDVVKKINRVNPDMILLLSNWPETFSYTLSEAIASGVPVIATDGGALRERVSRESVGFLVPVENPLPRIIEIIEDLKNHPEVISFMAENVSKARERLKTVDEMADAIFAVYRSLLNEK